MHVSLIAPHLNWITVRTLRHQLRFFHRRGDEPVIFTSAKLSELPTDIAAQSFRIEDKQLDLSHLAHFATSDLYIYHFTSAHPLLETMRSIEHGVVILHCHLAPAAVAETTVDSISNAVINALRPLASFADILVVDSESSALALLASGFVERDRVRSLAPAIPLGAFTPGPPDRALLQQHGWTGRQVMLSIVKSVNEPDIKLLAQAVAKVHAVHPDVVLALLHIDHDRKTSGISDPALEGITTVALEGAGNLLPYYRSAAAYLSLGSSTEDAIHALEAMACAKPVIGVASGAQKALIIAGGLPVESNNPDNLADQISRLLSEDDTYGKMVRLGHRIAENHALESYWIKWSNIVAEASAWLPNREYSAGQPFALGQTSYPASTQPSADSTTPMPQVEDWILPAEIERVKDAASVMLRDYRVRSSMPLFGPLIAWIRRNLTSHLREPYVDPIFQNQEHFNWQASLALEELARQLMAHKDALGQGSARLEDQRQELKTVVANLQRHVDSLLTTLASTPDAGEEDPKQRLSAMQTEELRRKLARFRSELSGLQG